jgi:hypothetical protein
LITAPSGGQVAVQHRDAGRRLQRRGTRPDHLPDTATAIGVGLTAVAYALLEVADAIRSAGQQQPSESPRR